MKCIDLFSGAGGSSLGAKLAGHEIIAAYDCNRTYLSSYHANHPDVPTFNEDILNLSAADLPQEADVLMGSTPCESFSQANMHDRSCDMALTERFMKLVADYKPRFWVLENVPQIKPFLERYFRYILHNSNHAIQELGGPPYLVETMEKAEPRKGSDSHKPMQCTKNQPQTHDRNTTKQGIKVPHESRGPDALLKTRNKDTRMHLLRRDGDLGSHTRSHEQRRSSASKKRSGRIGDTFLLLPQKKRLPEPVSRDTMLELQHIPEDLRNVPPRTIAPGKELVLTGTDAKTEGMAPSFSQDSIRILCSADYGVPQRRKRCMAGNYPEPVKTHKFGDLSAHIPFGRIKDSGDIEKYILSKNAIEGAYRRVHEMGLKGHQFKVKFVDEGTVLNTVTSSESHGVRAGSHIVYDNGRLRRLTLLECTRAQSFPDDYVFKGNLQQQYKQIGQAVPPLLMKAILKGLSGE